MIRGQLGQPEKRPTHVFVFEGLIGIEPHPIAEKAALLTRRFEAALDTWSLNYVVLDHMAFVVKHEIPVVVAADRPAGFCDLLYERLWRSDVAVEEVISGTYHRLSQTLATDPTVQTVYDPDLSHRYGYGFKVRELTPGQM